jgi:hypothetical protein
VSLPAPVKDRASALLECRLLSIKTRPIGLCVFPSGVVHVYECCDVGTLHSWQLYLLIWQSLLLWSHYHYQVRVNSCSPVVGLKIPSLSTSALKSPNKILMWYFENWSNTHSNPVWKIYFASSTFYSVGACTKSITQHMISSVPCPMYCRESLNWIWILYQKFGHVTRRVWSWTAWAVRSRVRIPLEAWIYVRVLQCYVVLRR